MRLFDNSWIDKYVKVKSDRVIAKLHDDKGNFLKSVIIPTVYYPLKSDKFNVFSCNNCEVVTDEKILQIFDDVTYQIGRCYSNSEELTAKLNEAGYCAVQYVGWLFVGEQIPVFHSWVVCGNHVLDLSEDFTVLYGSNHEAWENVKERGEFAELLADFYDYVNNNHVQNTVRCARVGVPTTGLLYVGCECNALDGIALYNTLIELFPNHEACRGKAGSYTPFQQMFVGKMKTKK